MGYPIDTEYRAREAYRAHLNTIATYTLFNNAYPKKRSMKKKIAYTFVAFVLKAWFSIRRFQGSFHERRVRRA